MRRLAALALLALPMWGQVTEPPMPTNRDITGLMLLLFVITGFHITAAWIHINIQLKQIREGKGKLKRC